MSRILILFFVAAFVACQSPQEQSGSSASQESAADTLRYEGETHLKNIRQLTFGGDNAEAYFSFDNQYLTLQRAYEAEGIPCDQIFFGKVPTSLDKEFVMQRVSNGQGRTTCSFFMPGDSTIIYASTHASGEDCPPSPDMRTAGTYVWPLYASYELFIGDRSGRVVRQLTDNEYYDAEATVSPKLDKIVFTSTRNGDIDLYVMDIDGSNLIQVTDEPGYDGGAFFSPDGSKIIFRASRFANDSALAEYRRLLDQDLVAPSDMELYVCNADGSDMQKITDLGNANWAPYFHPSGEKVIFASNHASGGRTFNLFMINLDGSGLEQITHDTQFDAFPMFSYDGKKLVFASNRNNGGTRETNLFIADWVE